MKSLGKILIISGPSGSGKTTLYRRLLLSKKLKGKISKSISATTRQRRAGERNGKDYIFLTEKQFLYRRRIGYFLESERVFDNYYGTPKKAVEALLRKGKNVLLCIDVDGAKNVSRQFPGAIKIFIKTPSLAVLKKRLSARASEDGEILKKRLARAQKELREAKSYNYIVINDRLPKAFKKLQTLVLQELG